MVNNISAPMRILKHIVLLLFIARFYLLAEADRKAAEAVWLRTLQAPGLQEKPWGRGSRVFGTLIQSPLPALMGDVSFHDLCSVELIEGLCEPCSSSVIPCEF